MSDTQSLLFANDFFYRCFAARDMKGLEEIWANSPSISCTHPGWNPVIGRIAVLESFRSIFLGPRPPDLRCVAPQGVILGDSGYVLCHEALEGGYLVATNVFIREGRLWRLHHHQAGPGGNPPETADIPPATMN
ncbi:MAG: nuclear transport factor 2 family protein [Pseudomonadota bacterium]